VLESIAGKYTQVWADREAINPRTALGLIAEHQEIVGGTQTYDVPILPQSLDDLTEIEILFVGQLHVLDVCPPPLGNEPQYAHLMDSNPERLPRDLR
jgi:hypothetical protein